MNNVDLSHEASSSGRRRSPAIEAKEHKFSESTSSSSTSLHIWSDINLGAAMTYTSSSFTSLSMVRRSLANEAEKHQGILGLPQFLQRVCIYGPISI
jgi:hypothetical protein